MKILFLGYDQEETSLIEKLEEYGHHVEHSKEKIDEETVKNYDLVISFGYIHLIKKSVIEACHRPPLNLHLSLLPFNRGDRPNFWAWYEGSPHGVTIHHIDEGIDTGDIVAQKEVSFLGNPTLKESYDQLRMEMEQFFIENIQTILNYTYKAIPQQNSGTIHFEKNFPQFSGGWDQTIDQVKKQID